MKRKEKERKNKYGDVKPMIYVEAKGKRFVAIGDKLYFSDKWRTFPDFLYDYLIYVFGEDWFNSEKLKPEKDQHPVMQWRYSIYEFQKSQKLNTDGLYKAIPSGPYKAYLTLAYDLYLLKHHMILQESIVKRLKIIDQFQGARYELFAASTMIRAGLDFELVKKGGGKIVEFIANHAKTGQKIAIEAKSRHRPGVLGHKGDRESPQSIRIRLGQLINKAINKKPEYPYLIFIDMNLPPEKVKDFIKSGLKELIGSLEPAPKTENDEDYFNMILYTNFPYHYGNAFDSYPEDHLSVAISLTPVHPVPNDILLKQIQYEVKNYGKIPNFFEE